MRLLMLWYYIISSILLILFPLILLVDKQTEYTEIGLGALFFTLPFHLHQIYYAHKDYAKHKLQKKIREQKYLQKKLKDLSTEIKEK